MYVRMARFEGLDEPHRRGRRRDEAADGCWKVRRAPGRGTRRGESIDGDPKRWVQLADRDKGTAIALAFCASEGDARRADEALNAMSPDQGQGRRVGAAEIYEVVLDESFA